VEVAQILIEDPSVRLISLTGSARSGWQIRTKAGTKRVTLELGGNAGVIVEPDADLDWAAGRCALGGYSYSGQSCISTQRIFVHQDVYAAFLDRFVPRVASLVVGDVLDDRTEVGPLISREAAERVAGWIAEAVDQGAQVATGGKRHGQVLEPTVLLQTTPEMRVNCEEVFAPLVTVTSYSRLDDAVTQMNASPYGLQAGVFTRDVRTLFRLHAELDVGGVNGNDIPGYRVDHLPYGGAKASGLGREGARHAIEEIDGAAAADVEIGLMLGEGMRDGDARGGSHPHPISLNRSFQDRPQHQVARPRDPGRERDSEHPRPHDASRHLPTDRREPVRGADAGDRAGDRMGRAHGHAEPGRQVERDGAARLGAEAAKWLEPRDALPHRLHDPPPARHRPQPDGGVRRQDHPPRDHVGRRQMERADGEVHEQRLARHQQRHDIPIVFCASLVPWPEIGGGRHELEERNALSTGRGRAAQDSRQGDRQQQGPGPGPSAGPPR
jgi:hypothetical protein